MPYHCFQCGKKYDELPKPLVCGGCAGRMFLKDRPKGVIKRVRAI